MTAFWRRRRVKWWRLFLGAIAGSLFLLCLFFEALSPLYSLPGKAALSCVMIFLAFGFSRFSLFLKDLLVFYMVTFLFGGGIFALQALWQSEETVLNGLVAVDGVYLVPRTVLAMLVLGYALMFLLSSFCYGVIETGKRRANYLLDVRVEIAGREVTCTGLLDTGNHLHEPLSRHPVMIMEVEKLAPVLPPAVVAAVREGGEPRLDLAFVEELPEEWQQRIRILPYRGVGKGGQFLIGIRPDRVEIGDGNFRHATSRVSIGLTKEKLSGDSAYAAILHPQMVKAGREEEKEKEGQYVGSVSP